MTGWGSFVVVRKSVSTVGSTLTSCGPVGPFTIRSPTTPSHIAEYRDVMAVCRAAIIEISAGIRVVFIRGVFIWRGNSVLRHYTIRMTRSQIAPATRHPVPLWGNGCG